MDLARRKFGQLVIASTIATAYPAVRLLAETTPARPFGETLGIPEHVIDSMIEADSTDRNTATTKHPASAYKKFPFRLKWNGRYVAGFSKASGLEDTNEVVGHRAGGDPSGAHKSPGRAKYEAITLKRGQTQDTSFHDWAGLVWKYGAGSGSEVSRANLRKDITLEFYNEAGQLVITYKIYRCWVSEYQTLPDLNADANAIAIEHIKLENEGWERDTAAAEPRRR